MSPVSSSASSSESYLSASAAPSVASSSAAAPAPLQGLRVLDLTRLLPGPVAALRLAELGADVLKIEAPGAGDPTRTMMQSSATAWPAAPARFTGW